MSNKQSTVIAQLVDNAGSTAGNAVETIAQNVWATIKDLAKSAVAAVVWYAAVALILWACAQANVQADLPTIAGLDLFTNFWHIAGTVAALTLIGRTIKSS
jgi:hypothetical protein